MSISKNYFKLDVRDLSVSVGEKVILDDINFSAESGEVIAIMGPSGAGKTTLITCLTTPQIPKQYTSSGSIRLNDELLAKYRDGGKLIGYSPQFDVYFPGFTMRQHLEYKAKLKFSSNVSAEDRAARIEAMVKELKIHHCMDSILGGEGAKSMSGGEIKRAMVASEMITSPPILILDEPTTGLDSAAASILITSLKDLAKHENCIILLSLHQPSSAIYFAFDRVLWLAQGQLLADSTPTHLIEALETADVACPTGEVVSNHMMDLLQNGDTIAVVKENKQHFIMQYGTSNEEEEGSSKRKSIKQILDESKFPNRFQQFITLSARHFDLRKKSYLTTSCILNKLLISVMLICVWWGAWQGELDVSTSIRNHTGYLWFHAQHFAFDTYYASTGDQTSERNVARSELSTRVYGNLEYSASRICAEVVFMGMYFIIVTSSGLLAGQAWNIEWWRWFGLYFIGLLHVSACAALSKMCGHMIVDQRSSAIVGDLYLMISSWTAGYYMNPNKLPIAIKWFRWISEIGNVYNAMVHTTLGGLEYTCDGPLSSICSSSNTIEGHDAWEAYSLDQAVWYNILFLFGLCVVFETGSVLLSKYSRVLRAK